MTQGSTAIPEVAEKIPAFRRLEENEDAEAYLKFTWTVLELKLNCGANISPLY